MKMVLVVSITFSQAPVLIENLASKIINPIIRWSDLSIQSVAAWYASAPAPIAIAPFTMFATKGIANTGNILSIYCLDCKKILRDGLLKSRGRITSCNYKYDFISNVPFGVLGFWGYMGKFSILYVLD